MRVIEDSFENSAPTRAVGTSITPYALLQPRLLQIQLRLEAMQHLVANSIGLPEVNQFLTLGL